MKQLCAVLTAATVAVGVFAPGAAAEPLRLQDAFQRVLQSHPDLAVFAASETALRAESERAALRPPLQAGASAENVLGTGAASALNGVELTLSLASVLERGDKRAARLDLAQARIDALGLQREARRLDLMAEVARRYLDVVAAQAMVGLSADDLAQRRSTVEAAAARVRAGAAPQSVRLSAEVAQLRAEGELQRSRRDQVRACQRLSLLWGELEPAFSGVEGGLQELPSVPDFALLRQRLADSPELRRFADESRVREARLHLARSASVADLEWQLGVRRLEHENDWGLVGSVSIPLGAAARAQPELRSAQAELAAVEFEREGRARGLENTLAEAWGQLDAAVAEATQLREQLLPQLKSAEAAAQRAFAAGSSSYLEWAQLQSESTAARQQQLRASLVAHRALIELQRLTGESFQPAESSP